MRLATLLREYDISSGTIRFPTGQAKGYRRADFTDAWHRYCPDTPAPDRTAAIRHLRPVPPATQHPDPDEMPPPPGAGAAGTA
jgi:hypothetical protein